LQQSRLVDLVFGEFLLLADQVLEGQRDWDALVVAQQRRPAVEETADLAPGLVLLDLLVGDGSDRAVVVLEPGIADGDADLVVAVDCRCPLVDHDCPQQVALVVALLLQPLQPLIDRPHLLLHLLHLARDERDLRIQVGRCSCEGSLSEMVVHLSNKRQLYVRLGKQRRFLGLQVLQRLLQVDALGLDLLQPFHQPCLLLQVLLLSLEALGLDWLGLLRLLALVHQYATLKLEHSCIFL
jgi:hypothetical protein